MADDDLAPVAAGGESVAVDRRTLLVGAAGALAAAGLSVPARAAGHATSVAAPSGPRFDPDLARRLGQALHDGFRDPSIHAPGAILHVQSPKLGRWTGVAGFGRVTPAEPMRPADRFRAGSIVKPFAAVAVLQLAERGRLSLDARLPEVLPASVSGRFANSADITVRMLLGHRAGIPDWDSPALDEQVARDPAKVWKVGELLDLAAAKPPLFAPGTSFSYSNTDYTLLGLIIERITGRSWRHEVTRRVIRPLRLTRTALPAPGHRSIKGPLAHGYVELDGQAVDVNVDPSFAGAAGGYSLATTVGDLARFLDALLAGRLFRHRATLKRMLTLAPAQGEGGLVGYGLGIERRALPGGAELIGHLGGAVYRSYVGRLRPGNVTIALALNAEDDPTPLLLPAVSALTATRR
ncbi:MAG: D-alanyl-D-alanine carboxypeptidase [Solirubrobacteraceae bacterium]|nr:D-alanyl-D-alanine carboxypeptidase [Solirubrobacteraceae bacterium]